jgi:hypothetical protein
MVTHEVMPNTAPLAGYVTPYEALHQVHLPWRVLIRDLHPYGCRVYVLIPREIRSHTHGVDKAVAGIFLGYSTTKVGFVVLTDNGIILDGVFNVFFKESTFPKAEARAARETNAPLDDTVTPAEAGAVQTWMNETGATPTVSDDVETGARGDVQGAVAPSAESSTSIDITDSDGEQDEEPQLDNVQPQDTEPSTPARVTVPPLEPMTSTKGLNAQVHDSEPSGPLLQAFIQATRPAAQSPQPPTGPLTPRFARRSTRKKQMSNKMIESLAERAPQPPDDTTSTPTMAEVTESEPSVEEHEKALAAAEDKAPPAGSRL